MRDFLEIFGLAVVFMICLLILAYYSFDYMTTEYIRCLAVYGKDRCENLF